MIKIKEFLWKALKYAVKYPALERNIISQNTASIVYAVLPDALRKDVSKATRKLDFGTKEYLQKMADVIEDEFLASVNSYNHKDGYQKAMSSFNTYKTNATLSPKGKKDDVKKGLYNSKSVNDILEHCKTSKACNKK